jgi:hypothetical protein
MPTAGPPRNVSCWIICRLSTLAIVSDDPENHWNKFSYLLTEARTNCNYILMKCMTCYVFCQNILCLSIFSKNMHIRLILTKINLDRISSLFKTTKQIKSKLCWESHWCSPLRIVSDSHDLNPKCRPLLKIEILPMPKSPYFN